MRLAPRTLTGRIILLLAAVLILSQLLSGMLLLRDRGQLLFRSLQEGFLLRAASVVRIMDSVSPRDREILLPAFNTAESRVDVMATPATPIRMTQPQLEIVSRIRQRLAQLLPGYARLRIELAQLERPLGPGGGNPAFGDMMARHREMMGEGGMGWRGERPAWRFMHGAGSQIRMIRVQVPLKDGSWLLLERRLPPTIYNWPGQLLLTIGLVILASLLVAWFTVRWVSRPLRNLRQASERLGREIHGEPVTEAGPLEIRETARSFNTMQQRLQRYIEDRERILTAVSHDLKTPLTRMRLRSDLLDDDALREKLQRDLGDMEQMVLATLDFMRGTESREESQEIDLGAMLESLQSDLQDQGYEIDLENRVSQPVRGRPLALKRCLSNLLENAVKYGERAVVKASQSKNEILIEVLDAGPGIPQEQLDRVFDPFFRLEQSRNRETGGSGLGLGIARNIARSHGGEITLQNRQPHGLCARLSLPR